MSGTNIACKKCGCETFSINVVDSVRGYPMGTSNSVKEEDKIYGTTPHHFSKKETSGVLVCEGCGHKINIKIKKT